MIIFSKKGIEFRFEGKETQCGIKYSYLIDGIELNKYNDKGFYGNATLDRKKKALIFTMHDIIINGKKQKINGVALEENVLKKFIEFEDSLIKEKEELENDLIKKLVSGELKIRWHDDTEYFDGYDMPVKSFKINIPEKLRMDELLEKALKELGINISDYKTVDYIKRSIKDNEKVGEMKLREIVKGRLENKKAQEEKLNAIFEKAKETGEKQEISHWMDDCNDKYEECNIDIVYEYAMPNGSTKIIRSHTY